MNPDPRIIATARLIEQLAHKMPAVRQHVRSQLNAIGQLRGTSYDHTGHTDRTVAVLITNDHGQPILDAAGQKQYDHVPCTKVEADALRRFAIDEHYADVVADIQSVATVVARILADCDRILGHRVAELEVPRCDSTGRDGADVWGEACWNVATRGPLCDKHSKREYRWRTRNGLPPRRDGVFAGDLEAGAR